MAFIGIMLANLLLMFLFITAFIATILLIISIILFVKSKKKEKDIKSKKVRKISARVTLIISILFYLPTIIFIFVLIIAGVSSKVEEVQEVQSIENRVYVERDEWMKGFSYQGKNLVPVNLLIEFERMYVKENLEEIGALVLDKTTSYYTLYELDNDSGYKLYYVHMKTKTKDDDYSCVFVEEENYDEVVKYYENAKLNASALWVTASQNSNQWYSLDLDITDKQEELIKLTYEVLDDVSNKNGISTNKDWDHSMQFYFYSNDKAFRIDLVINIKGDEMEVSLNHQKLEENIVNKYKDMLLDLVNESQEELSLKIFEE